jgi:Fe2+ transport system protein B
LDRLYATFYDFEAHPMSATQRIVNSLSPEDHKTWEKLSAEFWRQMPNFQLGPISDGKKDPDWRVIVDQGLVRAKLELPNSGHLTGDEIASEQLRHSIAGRFGHLIEPAIRPLGFDWKMGVGLVGAFAAREVFVSTMGITYAVGHTAESGTKDLSSAMQADRYADGRPVWTPLVAVSLLVWFVLAMQCMSTVAIVRRETGGWRWPIFMIVYMNALAYVLSLVVFQVGRIWFA